MKKSSRFITILLGLCLAFALTACGGGGNSGGNSGGGGFDSGGGGFDSGS